jgi:hypothetical protein
LVRRWRGSAGAGNSAINAIPPGPANLGIRSDPSGVRNAASSDDHAISLISTVAPLDRTTPGTVQGQHLLLPEAVRRAVAAASGDTAADRANRLLEISAFTPSYQVAT